MVTIVSVVPVTIVALVLVNLILVAVIVLVLVTLIPISELLWCPVLLMTIRVWLLLVEPCVVPTSQVTSRHWIVPPVHPALDERFRGVIVLRGHPSKSGLVKVIRLKSEAMGVIISDAGFLPLFGGGGDRGEQAFRLFFIPLQESLCLFSG